MANAQFSRRHILTGIAAGAATAFSLPGLAQRGLFPNRPIKVIVPWPAGGGGDIVVRMLAPGMSARLGQPVVVENRAGAVGSIGSAVAAKSPADGYTLVYGSADSHSIFPHLYKQVPYDAKRDFTAIAPIGFTPLALAVHASSPAKNMAQFVQMAKDAKEPLTYGSWGIGGSGQITMEAVKIGAKIDLLHVPYQGTAPQMQALLANQIACALLPVPVVDQHVKNGSVRVLAVVAKERLPGYLDIPTIKELGIPVDMGPWFGFLAPAGVPADVITRLHTAIDGAMADPQTIEAMKKISVVTERMEQPAYQTFYNNEFDRWGDYIRTAKITLQQ
jgi:tripartite-type tricarboxylate transporter receptor subunit TctC